MNELAERTQTIVQPRKCNRYHLQLPVIFSWKGLRPNRQQGVGLTRDLSVRGAFIFTQSPPPLKANVKLKALLLRRSTALPLRIFGQGEVIRLEPAHDGYRPGFAVSARPLVIRRGEVPRTP